MKVFFDASVIISALLSLTGGSSLLISLIKSRRIMGITSQTVIDEVIAHADKIRRGEKDIFDFIQSSRILVRTRISIEDVEQIKNLMIDPYDAHVFAGAILTKSDYLVSLDKKHILQLDITKLFPKIHICSPKELLNLIK